MAFDLTGCYDLHIHTAPDVIPRKLTDLEMGFQAKKHGMAGFMIKSHKFPTCGRADAIRAIVPELDVLSGIALNQSVGGLNPDAVLAAAKMGAKFVWLPTVDAKAYRKLKNNPTWESGLSFLDADGKPKESMHDIADIVKEYDLVLCSGHIGASEAMAFSEFCNQNKVKRFVITHASFSICQDSVENLNQQRKLGAMIEYSYTHVLSGVCTLDFISNQLKELGSTQIYLSTDLGQTENMYPVNGLSEFCEKLMEKGISRKDIYQMVRDNPTAIVR